MVPRSSGTSTGKGATGNSWLTVRVWHDWFAPRCRTRQNGVIRGGMMSTETLIIDEVVVEIEEVEELLVEEVSIDGLCGVY